MAEKIELDLEQNSPYRVALELAYQIARSEKKMHSASFSGVIEGGDRKYWLELYEQCRMVVVEKRQTEFALKGYSPALSK